MSLRYGDADSYIEIRDDGTIAAAGEGDYGPGQATIVPQASPPPSEGTEGYEAWCSCEEALEPDDKTIHLVDQESGTKYLFVFRTDCSIGVYYLGHNFHAGVPTYLLLLRVPSQPDDDAVKWNIYDWIKNL